jgi:hypothetical protein
MLSCDNPLIYRHDILKIILHVNWIKIPVILINLSDGNVVATDKIKQLLNTPNEILCFITPNHNYSVRHYRVVSETKIQFCGMFSVTVLYTYFIWFLLALSFNNDKERSTTGPLTHSHFWKILKSGCPMWNKILFSCWLLQNTHLAEQCFSNCGMCTTTRHQPPFTGIRH